MHYAFDIHVIKKTQDAREVIHVIYRKERLLPSSLHVLDS